MVTFGSGRPISATVTGDANQDGNSTNDRLPGVSRNSLVAPDYANAGMRQTSRILLSDKVKLELMAEPGQPACADHSRRLHNQLSPVRAN